MMRYHVNENCIGCGMCESICPDVFSMGNEGTAVAIERDAPTDAIEAASEAKESCPVGAIEEV